MILPRSFSAALRLGLLAGSLAASGPAPAAPVAEMALPPSTGSVAEAACGIVESAAQSSHVPVGLLTRLVWTESRFRADAISPAGAQGIAQFMPGTAAEHRLDDPFDPIQALPKSAEFLHDLWNQFGNPGLAAAAYNAGPQRVRDWLAGKRALPMETQNYVRKVTGRAVEEWTKPEQKPLVLGFPQGFPCAVTAGPIEANLPENKPAIAGVAFKPSIAALSVKPAGAVMTVSTQSAPGWFVQLAGDRSEFKAMAAYFALQRKHQAILGSLAADLVRTTPRPGAAPIWSRVRVAAGNRLFAEALCSRLRAAGESCLVQRN